MLIAVLQYISGYLRIRVEGYSPERFINLCSYHGIYLWNLKPCGHAYEMNISVRGFRELKPVIRKTRTKVVIMERAGFPFYTNTESGSCFSVESSSVLSLFMSCRFLYGISISTGIFRGQTRPCWNFWNQKESTMEC